MNDSVSIIYFTFSVGLREDTGPAELPLKGVARDQFFKNVHTFPQLLKTETAQSILGLAGRDSLPKRGMLVLPCFRGGIDDV